MMIRTAGYHVALGVGMFSLLTFERRWQRAVAALWRLATTHRLADWRL